MTDWQKELIEWPLWLRACWWLIRKPRWKQPARHMRATKTFDERYSSLVTEERLRYWFGRPDRVFWCIVDHKRNLNARFGWAHTIEAGIEAVELAYQPDTWTTMAAELEAAKRRVTR